MTQSAKSAAREAIRLTKKALRPDMAKRVITNKAILRPNPKNEKIVLPSLQTKAKGTMASFSKNFNRAFLRPKID